jgi:hypothetical protein
LRSWVSSRSNQQVWSTALTIILPITAVKVPWYFNVPHGVVLSFCMNMNPLISLKKHDGSLGDYLKLFLFSVVAVSFYVSFIDFGLLGHSNLFWSLVQSLLQKIILISRSGLMILVSVQSYHTCSSSSP